MTDVLQQLMNFIENTRMMTSVSGVSVIGFGILFIFGVLNCILGYRLLRFWMMLFGFAIGAGIGAAAAYSMGITAKTTYAAAAIGTGVVIAVIAFLSYKIGIFILGMGIGLGLGIYFFRPTSSGVFFLCLLLGVGFGVFAMKWAREILIVGTSLLGGIMAGLSLSKLAGLADFPYGVGLSAGFALFGMLIQFLTNRRRVDEEDDEEDEIEGEKPEREVRRRKETDAEEKLHSEGREKERSERRNVQRRKTSGSRHERSRGMIYAPELEREKTVVYRREKKEGPEMPLGGFKNTGRAYERREEDYDAEPYEEEPIDEELLDEEVLKEMMDEDDREGEELWKKLTGRKSKSSKKKKAAQRRK